MKTLIPNMTIFIPTRGRVDRQKTFNMLPNSLKQQTYLVVDSKERKTHIEKFGVERVWVLPPKVKGIAYIRQYIIDNCESKYCCMLDDDIAFQVRNNEGRIINATNDRQVESAFKLMHKWLDKDKLSHCGMAFRTISYASPESYGINTRMMHALFYNVEDLETYGCKFTNNVPRDFSMDDFHMTLQLLENGRGNRVSFKYRVNPSASNSKGGASEWRTLNSHNKSAMLLDKLHKHAKAVKKHKWQGMDGERYDVIIQWKRCIEEGMS